jgi:hypothetical protein
MLRDTGENTVLHLYKNNVTPSATSVIGSFTEAAFTGYSAKTLTRGSWDAASTNVDGKAETAYANQTWTVTTANSETIYGYYVTSATGGALLFAESFTTPRVLVDRDTLTIPPKFTFRSEN